MGRRGGEEKREERRRGKDRTGKREEAEEWIRLKVQTKCKQTTKETVQKNNRREIDINYTDNKGRKKIIN